MFEKFSDYMYYLLFTPLHKVIKSKNQFFLFFKVIGKLFDKIKSVFFMVREESMISTASAELLNEHARDRQMTRYIGEDIENFRNRLCMKFIISELAGSEQGVLLAVKSLGFEHAESVPCYLTDRERWAEFYIVVTTKIDESNPIDLNVLKHTVRQVKQASAKDNYCFKYDSIEMITGEVITPRLINRLSLNWWKTNVCYDGSILYDGKYKFDSETIQVPLQIRNRLELNTYEDSVTKVTIQNNLWYFDGLYNFDGTMVPNAYKREVML